MGIETVHEFSMVNLTCVHTQRTIHFKSKHRFCLHILAQRICDKSANAWINNRTLINICEMWADVDLFAISLAARNLSRIANCFTRSQLLFNIRIFTIFDSSVEFTSIRDVVITMIAAQTAKGCKSCNSCNSCNSLNWGGRRHALVEKKSQTIQFRWRPILWV